MARISRSLLISILALCHERSQKQLGAAAGMPQKRVSQVLGREEIDDEVFERLVAAVQGRPAAVPLGTAFLEALAGLEPCADLTEEELAEVEMGVLEVARLVRPILAEAARRSRQLPALDAYPKPADLEPARWHAGVLFSLLKRLPEDQQSAVVRVAREFQSWALVERLCEESVIQASRNIERAASLARLAREIADRVRGPEPWRNGVQGFAAAHGANALRVAGELPAAEAAFEQAKALWNVRSDPEKFLDAGRLVDLEASLRRDQRRFDEALGLLDDAITMGRRPGRALVNKAFTLEVMGENQRAIETLLQAESLAEIQGDPRLRYILHINLALNLVQVGRFGEAAELASQVRQVAGERGDEIIALRVTWLDGRIAAGLGRPAEARALLEQARRGFAARGMWYDVALALLEIAVLLLDEGQTAEVRSLARGLAEVFKANGVHREALASLRLFREAAEREEATAELARRVLGYLIRARYDPGFRFAI